VLFAASRGSSAPRVQDTSTRYRKHPQNLENIHKLYRRDRKSVQCCVVCGIRRLAPVRLDYRTHPHVTENIHTLQGKSTKYRNYPQNAENIHKCAVCCSVLQCVAVCCSVLQCVAVCVAIHTESAVYWIVHKSYETFTHYWKYSQTTENIYKTSASKDQDKNNIHTSDLHNFSTAAEIITVQKVCRFDLRENAQMSCERRRAVVISLRCKNHHNREGAQM